MGTKLQITKIESKEEGVEEEIIWESDAVEDSEGENPDSLTTPATPLEASSSVPMDALVFSTE
jgi:hypothetical protein